MVDREFRKHLQDLTASVLIFLAKLDYAMKRPQSLERDRIVARLANALEMANDQGLHFGLGRSFGAIKADKRHMALAVVEANTAAGKGDDNSNSNSNSNE